MPEVITRDQIKTLLCKWQAGEVSHRQVFEWANDRFAAEKWTAEDEITNEVLAQLDTLNMNLTTTEDIPHLLQVLALPSIEIETALTLQDSYSSKIDIRSRRAALASDPFYAPFCR